jgi:hypothetical protein
VLDSPAAIGLLTGLIASAFVISRIVMAGRGDIAAFVLAGSAHVNAATTPRGLPVFPGQGYDGQFYYRLALDPLDFARSAYGITLDTVSRLQRIGYPALSWLLALGKPSLVPASMVAVNLVELALLGMCGAIFARDAGRHCAWGLLVPGYWGFVMSLSRDLTEITEALFVVVALLMLRRSRPLAAGIAFSAAVLSKEPAALIVLAIGAVRIAGIPARPSGQKVGRGDLAWAIPGSVFVSWQLIVLHATGKIPALRDGHHNLGIPFVAMAQAIAHYVSHLPATVSLLWCTELAGLALVTVLAARWWTRSSAPLGERVAWLLAGLLAVSLAQGIWMGAVDFRSLDDLYVLGILVLLASPARLRLLGAAVPAVWLVAAVHLAVFL